MESIKHTKEPLHYRVPQNLGWVDQKGELWSIQDERDQPGIPEIKEVCQRVNIPVSSSSSKVRKYLQYTTKDTSSEKKSTMSVYTCALLGLPTWKINLRILNNLYHAHEELTDA